MNKKDYLKPAKRMARVTHKLCRLFIWITAIGTVLMLSATIYLSVYPMDRLQLTDNGAITIGNSSLSLPFISITPYTDSAGNENFRFDGGILAPSETLSSVQTLRSYLWVFFAKIAIGALIFILSAIFLMGLLESVEKGTPFEPKNSSRLRSIGFTLVIGSIAAPTVSTIVALLTTHTNLLDIKSNMMIDLTLLLCGLLILILSGIFAYGARLQLEHDQTV